MSDFKKAATETLQGRQPPNGKVVAILAVGGTFLCRSDETPRSPKHYEKFEDFIQGCNLEEEFERKGLYQNDNGDWFLRDGTQVVYHGLAPSIDSTNATSETERLRIQEAIESTKETYGIHTNFVLIQGTDTGANTAGIFDLIYGRNMDGGLAIVTSQEPADGHGSDGPENFATAFEATQRYRQVIVVSDKGRMIFNGNVRKTSDNSFKIYTGRDGEHIAVKDLNEIRSNNNADPVYTHDSSTLPVIPTTEDYDNITIMHYEPTASGNQKIQARLVAQQIHASLTGSFIRRILGGGVKFVGAEFVDNFISTAQKMLNSRIVGRLGISQEAAEKLLSVIRDWLGQDSVSALTIKMAGSNNIPSYAEKVLIAADNILPIFASSDVPGAKTSSKDGTAKYAAAGVELARKLGLNNLIELPATRIGPDMRPEAIMVCAAKYAAPRTPEFLLFCHLFASFAWTSEDNGYSNSITGERHDLVSAMNRIESVKAKVLRETSMIQPEEMSKRILGNAYVRDILKRHIPDYVMHDGKYQLDDNGKLGFQPRHKPWFDTRPGPLNSEPV